jgi:predicted nicotinamide N-methyase
MSDDEHDPYDLFDASISTIFDVPPIAFSADRGGLYTYTPPRGPSIDLRIPDPPAAHQKLQANHLWLSAVYLAEQICTDLIHLANLRVVELGAGAGLPSVMAATNGAEVVCTDWGVDGILSAIAQNLKGKGRAAVVGHMWGTDVQPILDALDGPKRFDAVMLADTLWATDAHPQLLDSITALLAPTGVAHVAAGLHTGRGPVERFRAAAAQRGYELGGVTEVQWVTGTWEPYQTNDGLEEERGVVVYFTMRMNA